VAAVPNRETRHKYPFLDAVLTCARRVTITLFVGDTNSGRRGLDEQVPAFNTDRGRLVDGLRDADGATRSVICGPTRAPTPEYSPNGHNGFRIDQTFVNAALLAPERRRVRLGRAAWGAARSSATTPRC
jgi:hypothetical protein